MNKMNTGHAGIVWNQAILEYIPQSNCTNA